jgi:hypothetical protein
MSFTSFVTNESIIEKKIFILLQEIPIPFLTSPLKKEEHNISLPFRGRARVGVGLNRCLFNHGPISKYFNKYNEQAKNSSKLFAQFGFIRVIRFKIIREIRSHSRHSLNVSIKKASLSAGLSISLETQFEGN